MSDLPPIDELRAVMDPFLNGVIMEGLACGIYTLLLGQAIWQLHKTSKTGIYSYALIVLWICIITIFSCDWTAARAGFIVHNDSPVDIANNLVPTVPLLGLIVNFMGIVISDAIIVWRCYVLWRNKYILGLLLALLTTTAVLLLCDDILGDINLTARFTFLVPLFSFLTTISATSLIAWRITSLTRQSHTRHSYTKIIQILVESAALVSIVLLGVTILALIDTIQIFKISTKSGKALFQAAKYFNYLQGPAIGIAPTLIAFRVAMTPLRTEVNGTSGTGPFHLRFRRPGHDNVNSQGPQRTVSTIQFGVGAVPDDISSTLHGQNHIVPDGQEGESEKGGSEKLHFTRVESV